jgi:hypothetical protein
VVGGLLERGALAVNAPLELRPGAWRVDNAPPPTTAPPPSWSAATAASATTGKKKKERLIRFGLARSSSRRRRNTLTRPHIVSASVSHTVG